MLLRNKMDSAEKPYWYLCDDIRVEKTVLFSFLEQQEDFCCWRSFFDVLNLRVYQHIFLT